MIYLHKGPFLNDMSKRMTTRDNLGIEGVAISMQDDICPVVTTVTPRVFYWAFLTWIYYDFHKYSGIKDKNETEFSKYLKRQDYFFILASILIEGEEQKGLNGRTQVIKDKKNNENGPYIFNKDYFQNKLGGMMYHNAGCVNMRFIDEKDIKGNIYDFPILSPEGEKLAIAFENVIKNTTYYKEYRITNIAVPRNVLEEYGRAIKFNLDGFDECKEILKKNLFNYCHEGNVLTRCQLLNDCAEYIKFIASKCNCNDMDERQFRQIFYDYQLPVDNSKFTIPEKLKTVAYKWEIVIGRQYFVIGLEMIWKYMIEQLSEPMSLNMWLDNVIHKSNFKWNKDDYLINVIQECCYSYSVREEMIQNARTTKDNKSSIEDGLRLLCSVYNHFLNRKNILDDEQYFFNYGEDTESISLHHFFDFIEKYKNNTIEKTLRYIMKNFLVEQHYITAFNKLLYGRDGFYYEIIDNQYIWKHDYKFDFQGLRMVSLKQVMIDLGMI